MTVQMLLEQPARGSSSLTSSLTAYDMGYDMLTECSMESILTDQKEGKEDAHFQNCVEVWYFYVLFWILIGFTLMFFSTQQLYLWPCYIYLQPFMYICIHNLS